MPTAARRRADAARAARRATAPPPVQPPEPVHEEPVAEVPPVPEPEPDPEPVGPPTDRHGFISMVDHPPFDVQAEGRQEHGPYRLRLNGRSRDTAAGEIVLAVWNRGATISGGFGWGWRTRDGRAFGVGGVEAWCLPPE